MPLRAQRNRRDDEEDSPKRAAGPNGNPPRGASRRHGARQVQRLLASYVPERRVNFYRCQAARTEFNYVPLCNGDSRLSGS
jgi:hypothetical protein